EAELDGGFDLRGGTVLLGLAEAEGEGEARAVAEVVDALGQIDREALEVEAEAEVGLRDRRQSLEPEPESEAPGDPILAAEAQVRAAGDRLVDVQSQRQALLEELDSVADLHDDGQLVVG